MGRKESASLSKLGIIRVVERIEVGGAQIIKERSNSRKLQRA